VDKTMKTKSEKSSYSEQVKTDKPEKSKKKNRKETKQKNSTLNGFAVLIRLGQCRETFQLRIKEPNQFISFTMHVDR
jgi:hypothetical protein